MGFQIEFYSSMKPFEISNKQCRRMLGESRICSIEVDSAMNVLPSSSAIPKPQSCSSQSQYSPALCDSMAHSTILYKETSSEVTPNSDLLCRFKIVPIH
jgi:hypothetical protein